MQLPTIERIEILTLIQNPPPDQPTLGVLNAEQKLYYTKTVPLTGAKAHAIAELWRHLPTPAMQMRCHMPPYGVRFYAGDHLITEATICWRCNNIRLTDIEHAGGYSFVTFDGTASVSKQLLDMFNKLTGHTAAG